MVVILGR